MLNHCGCTFKGSQSAPKQSSRDLRAWWLPHSALTMVASRLFWLMRPNSIVDAPKQACGATLAAMKSAFILSSISRGCNLIAESRAVSNRFPGMEFFGYIAGVTRAPRDFASWTINKGDPSTERSLRMLIPSFVLESPIDSWNLRNCPDSLSKCMVRSNSMSRCLHEGDLKTLSST